MERMEQLIRESLQARAQDVEPTPALWLEVDRRVARRRRYQVLSWSLAGAAAVVAAVLAVPAIVGLVTGPEELDIAPLDRVPAAGVVSTHAVAIDAAGELTVVDLRTGEPTTRGQFEAGVTFDGGIDGLSVAPTSTEQDLRLAVAAHRDLGPTVVTVVDGEPTVTAIGSGGERTSVVVSPDGTQVAYLRSQPEADGATVLLAPLDAVGDEGQPAVQAAAVIESGSRLLEWVAAEDATVLWVQRPDGTVVGLRLDPATLGEGVDTQPLFEGNVVLDAASSWVAGGTEGEPFYVLRRGADGIELVWTGPAGRTATLALDELLGDVAPADLWLDAKQDGALVGDGGRTWLIAHDGAGAFIEPVPLPDGIVRAGLLDVARPGGVPADDPTAEPTADPTAEPTTEPTAGPRDGPSEPEATEPGQQPEGPVVEGAPLPAPIVTISMRDLVLHGPDGPQTLYRLSPEGESVFISARVHPDSTMDDLTVVALTQGEGMFDLRTFRYVDGELTWDYFPDEYQPTGDGTVATGPVWSPDGEHLAWFEFRTGQATMRTIGWQDGAGTGEPATDNAAFELDAQGQDPMYPVEWVLTPEGPLGTEIRATALDPSDGWYALPVDLQADGAVALASPSFEVRPGSGAGRVAGVAGGADHATRWLLELTVDGAVLVDLTRPSEVPIDLPGDLMPGDGLVELWVRSIGDGALVGSRNTAVGYHVAPDGSISRLPGEVSDADVIR
jgi:hypothetical protein